MRKLQVCLKQIREYVFPPAAREAEPVRFGAYADKDIIAFVNNERVPFEEVFIGVFQTGEHRLFRSKYFLEVQGFKTGKGFTVCYRGSVYENMPVVEKEYVNVQYMTDIKTITNNKIKVHRKGRDVSLCVSEIPGEDAWGGGSEYNNTADRIEVALWSKRFLS